MIKERVLLIMDQCFNVKVIMRTVNITGSDLGVRHWKIFTIINFINLRIY
jgi:hypothetical protein